MILVLFSGFLFDIVGRRKTIFLAFILCGISALIMPFTQTVFPGLLLARILFSVSIMPIVSNPLINDYITVDDRGKAFAVHNLS